MRIPIQKSFFLFLPLLLAGVGLAACGNSSSSGSNGGNGSTSGSGGGGGGASDPCAGKACGDMCSTCPPDAECAAEACDAFGACVEADKAVCGMCPDSEPAEGSACPKVGLVCDLDEGIIIVCRARTQCTMTGWKNLAPGCSSDPLTDDACPAAPPTGACDVMNDPTLCDYKADSFCGCSNCLGGPCGGPGEWVCATQPPPPCPAIAPKLGSVCTDEGAKCVYGNCALGGTSGGRSCFGGIWIEDIVECPL